MTSSLGKSQPTKDIPFYEVIIVGGSFSGLAAAMSLGRALRKVLIIDDGKPCNRFAPHSHNFLTRDGVPPEKLLQIAKEELATYSTIEIIADRVLSAEIAGSDFSLQCASDRSFRASKLLFATGLRDILPTIPGFADCWGASIIHCPYCHGYEYKGQPTGILADGAGAMHYAQLLSQWTDQLSLFTNGPTALSPEQVEMLKKRGIKIYESPIERIQSTSRAIHALELRTAENKLESIAVSVLYHGPINEQSCSIPSAMGCKFDEATGLLQLDGMQQTTIPGIYAAGDNSGPRSVSAAVGSGSFAGAAINNALIQEKYALEN